MKTTVLVLLGLIVLFGIESCSPREEPQPDKSVVSLPPLEVRRTQPGSDVTVNAYVSDSTNSPLRGNILKAAVDPENRLWVCAKVRGSTDHPARGLAYFDGKTWTAVTRATFPGLPDDGAYDITFDAAGTSWFGTMSGLVALKNEQPQLYAPSKTFSEMGSMIFRVVAVRSGRIWIAGVNNLGDYDGTGFASIPAEGLYSQGGNLVADRSSGLWAPTMRGLVFIDEREMKTFTRANAPLPANDVTQVAVAPNGEVWFSVNSKTGQKLFCLDKGTFRTLDLGALGNEETVKVLACDAQNRVWFHVNHKQLYRISPDGTVQKINLPALKGFIADLTFDQQNAGWLSADKQLIRFNE